MFAALDEGEKKRNLHPIRFKDSGRPPMPG
jgi:hypothetical protein